MEAFQMEVLEHQMNVGLNLEELLLQLRLGFRGHRAGGAAAEMERAAGRARGRRHQQPVTVF